MVKTDYQNGDILSARDINDYGTEINTKANKSYVDTELEKKANINDLSEIAISGNYNDLTNKPYIPTKTTDLTNDSGFITQHQDISGKENLSNKVVTVNENSTDIQYPSAKCLYDLVQQIKAEIKLEDHPLYSLYWSLDPTMTEVEANDSTSSKHPSTLFGGTWERIKDRFILAAGDKFIKDYQPVYGGDNEGDLYPVSFSSFRVGDENMDGGVFNLSSEGGYISRQKDWSPTFAYHYNNKTYISISLSWYRLYENQQSNRIELIGLRDNGVTWEPLGLSSNLYIYMSDGSVYTITPNMLSSEDLYPDQITNNYGGEEAVYLSISEMAKHRHDSEPLWAANSPDGTRNTIAGYPVANPTKAGQYGIQTENTGGSQPHNNMPPYEIAYCWMRIPDPIST